MYHFVVHHVVQLHPKNKDHDFARGFAGATFLNLGVLATALARSSALDDNWAIWDNLKIGAQPGFVGPAQGRAYQNQEQWQACVEKTWVAKNEWGEFST